MASGTSQTPPDPASVERAAKAYLDSDTDTRATLRVILASDEFKAAAGQKVKLPLRALVSSVRALGADVGDGDQLLPDFAIAARPAPDCVDPPVQAAGDHVPGVTMRT